MKEIDPRKLRSGMIWHHRWDSLTCCMIRKILRSWGCHDGIVIRSGPAKAGIGDSRPFRARTTPLSYYNEMIRGGILEVRIYELVEATYDQERAAVSYWLRNVHGTIYDFGAFPLLFTKAMLGDWLPTVAGWEWANWCTEGVMMSYLKGAGLDPWNKRNSTPKTTENRAEAGLLRDVTEDVQVD